MTVRLPRQEWDARVEPKNGMPLQKVSSRFASQAKHAYMLGDVRLRRHSK
jgi:hypothetical protein